MRKYAGIWMLALLVAVVPLLSGATPPSRTALMGGRYALELDGVLVGALSEVEGGYAVADVVSEKMGPDDLARKHIAGVKYEDITVTFGAGMDARVVDWVKSAFDGKTERKSGSIIYIDRDGREEARLNFSNAWITEVDLPALDAASKDAAKMTVKFKPEYTRRVAGSGKPVPVRYPKPWLPANFRLTIDGLDSAATDRVNKIEAIVVKQKVTSATGDGQDPVPEPAGLEISNLVVRLGATSANPLYAWHDDFVIKGNNGEDQERTGTLEYLSPDLRTVLFRLQLQGIGIMRAEPAPSVNGVEQVEAEMYLNAIQIEQP